MDRRMRLIIIGCGNHGMGWVKVLNENMREEVEVVGVVDRNSDKLSKLPKGIRGFLDLETAILETKPETAINITAPDMHFEVNQILLEKGIKVLCEKPLTNTLDEAKTLLKYCEQNDGFCMIAENYRYRDVWRLARERIEKDDIGKIHRIRCNFSHFHPDYSKFYHGKLEHPLLTDVTIHHLDLARYITGKEAKRVWCKEWAGSHKWYKDRPATAMLYSEMEDDILFEYTGTVASTASATDWYGDWEIEGEKGTMLISDTAITILAEGKTEKIICEDSKEDTRILVMEEFLRARKESCIGETDIRDNYKCFRWLQEAIDSSIKGKEVEVND
ncbi:putative dehydrogenase [Aequitasia blattaphilus]|uniref:Gfo/Idh/MocA family oxidoreductase n=1 Tax=Aequitasia blattaphilus TaxID=2949332 RepID=A0ABT1EB00_9FIRM|nr:Gfo/Idh/MocA family oxidoreductase [Aequitasia blattaphilus]MCP1103009.1 Gfo/Idh/MocA family oxidoreductase [Aequitasia blattaphilus]MCR8615649.1 Gfo/Idh/MocA family oxidoreductase [Aequitasia blattaphilus]